jgi:hypothetical protein
MRKVVGNKRCKEMKAPKSFVALMTLLLLAMQAHADAIGKGLDSDVTVQSLPAAAQVRAQKAAATAATKFISMPEGLPANTHCLSGGQPCAEEAQKEADDFKAARNPQ